MVGSVRGGSFLTISLTILLTMSQAAFIPPPFINPFSLLTNLTDVTVLTPFGLLSFGTTTTTTTSTTTPTTTTTSTSTASTSTSTSSTSTSSSTTSSTTTTPTTTTTSTSTTSSTTTPTTTTTTTTSTTTPTTTTTTTTPTTTTTTPAAGRSASRNSLCPHYPAATDTDVTADVLTGATDGWYVYKSTPNIAESGFQCINVKFESQRTVDYRYVPTGMEASGYTSYTGLYTAPARNEFSTLFNYQLIFGADNSVYTDMTVVDAEKPAAIGGPVRWLVLKSCSDAGAEYVYVLTADRNPASPAQGSAYTSQIEAAVSDITGLTTFNSATKCPV